MYFSLISEISLMNKSSFQSLGFLQTSELQIFNYSLPCLSIVTKSIATSAKICGSKRIECKQLWNILCPCPAVAIHYFCLLLIQNALSPKPTWDKECAVPMSGHPLRPNLPVLSLRSFFLLPSFKRLKAEKYGKNSLHVLKDLACKFTQY